MNLDLNLRVEQFSKIIGDAKVTDEKGIPSELANGLSLFRDRLFQAQKNSKNLYIVGNGGSAGVAAHAVTDFFNVAKIRASTLHESSLLTCMANDFGYENAVARMLAQLLNPGDVVIVISSSGKSLNMQNAALVSKKNGAFVVTLSGFSSGNPLSKLGDLNIWLNSNDYGFVEIGHQFILHNIADRFNESLTG
jgi:D-sedoheptulose 7-phosphate isomerase